MLRRLLDRILPDEAFGGVGFVAWRIDDGWIQPGSIIASGGFCAPAFGRASVQNWRWRPWPSVSDLLPVFTVDRGGIDYGRIWDDPLPRKRSAAQRRRALEILRRYVAGRDA